MIVINLAHCVVLRHLDIYQQLVCIHLIYTSNIYHNISFTSLCKDVEVDYFSLSLSYRLIQYKFTMQVDHVVITAKVSSLCVDQIAAG